MRCTRAMPSSMVAGRSPSKRSGVWTVCPPLPSSPANARTPSVSPSTWWNSTTSAIGALLSHRMPGQSLVGGGHRFHVGGGLGRVDEEVVDRGGVREDLGELVGDLLELRGGAEDLLRVHRQ